MRIGDSLLKKVSHILDKKCVLFSFRKSAYLDMTHLIRSEIFFYIFSFFLIFSYFLFKNVLRDIVCL